MSKDTIQPIGSRVYVVNKKWKNHPSLDARIIPARITTYQRIKGKIYPVVTAGRIEYDPQTNFICPDLKQALKHLV